MAHTAVRSLALLAHVLDDKDKLSQVTRDNMSTRFILPSLLGACKGDITDGQGGDSGI